MSYKSPFPVKRPSGSTPRAHIEDIFNYAIDTKLLKKVNEEYSELLSVENKFRVEDVYAYTNVSSQCKSVHIPSYTQLGNDLKKMYPDSTLIKVICDLYLNSRVDSQRYAIKEYYELKEISRAYADLKKQQPSTKLSQTYYPQSSGKTPGAAKQFSQTLTPQYNHHDIQQPQGSVGSKVSIPVENADQVLMYNGEKYFPETKLAEIKQHSDIQQKDIMDMQKQLKEKDQEISDLRSRLSSFASKQLTEGNPDFTDLSDKNRPSRIAERFHSMYDEEWTTSLEALTSKKTGQIFLSEEEGISFLMEIVKIVYNFCINYSAKQKQALTSLWKQSLENPFLSEFSVESSQPSSTKSAVPESVMKEFIRLRRSDHKNCIENAIKRFKEDVISKQPKFQGKMIESVEQYVEHCVEILWLMSIQDPPMLIRWPEPGVKFDHENYKEYLKKGKTVKLAVWPAVFLHEKGALVNKGFAMPE